MTSDAKQRLAELIDELAELSKRRHALQRKRRKILLRTRLIRAALVIEIAKAKDEKGKPVYSNEQLREAALTLQLEKNDEYRRLRAERLELEDQDEELIIESNRIVDQKLLLFAELGLLLQPDVDETGIALYPRPT